MGWTDEAYRDTENLFGRGTDAMHITGDLSLADFGTLIEHEGYPKLADYLHGAFPGTKFIAVGEKSYAVESAVAPTGDIGVRMSGRSSSTLDACGLELGGRYRQPAGKAVPDLPLATVLRAVLHQLGGRAVRLRHQGRVPVVDLSRGRQPILPGDRRVRPRGAHGRGRLGRGCRDRDDAARAVVGHVRHARRRSTRRATCGVPRRMPPPSPATATRMTRSSRAPRRPTSDARRRSPTSSWVGCSRPSRTWTRPTAGRPWWCSPPTMAPRSASSSTGRPAPSASATATGTTRLSVCTTQARPDRSFPRAIPCTTRRRRPSRR